MVEVKNSGVILTCQIKLDLTLLLAVVAWSCSSCLSLYFSSDLVISQLQKQIQWARALGRQKITAHTPHGTEYVELWD